jgi:hypothetical protein
VDEDDFGPVREREGFVGGDRAFTQPDHLRGPSQLHPAQRRRGRKVAQRHGRFRLRELPGSSRGPGKAGHRLGRIFPRRRSAHRRRRIDLEGPGSRILDGRRGGSLGGSGSRRD